MAQVCKNLTRTAEDFAKLPAVAAKPDVLEVIFADLIGARPPTKRIPRRVEISTEGPLIDFAHRRSPYTVGCFAYDNPGSMSRTTVSISEPEVWLDIVAEDRVSDRRDRQPSAMTLEEATALAKKLKGDFLYSDKSNELIGVNGTEFALIEKNSVGECFSLSGKVIQALLNAIGKMRFSLREYRTGTAFSKPIHSSTAASRFPNHQGGSSSRFAITRDAWAFFTCEPCGQPIPTQVVNVVQALALISIDVPRNLGG